MKRFTERHLDLLGDPFDAHERERDNRDNGYCRPAQLLDHSKREGEEVQRHALFEMNPV